MNKKLKIRDMEKIRDMLMRVWNGTATTEEDVIIYRMYGSLSHDQADGMVMGINTCLDAIK